MTTSERLRVVALAVAGVGLFAALVFAAGCGGPEGESGPVDGRPSYDPAVEVDLNTLIGSPPGGFTWQFRDGWGHSLADGAGLSLTAAGLLRTPDCRLPNPPGWPYPIFVEAWQNGAKVYEITITADEKFISSRVVCFVVSGETLCRDPAQGVTVEVGQTVTFYTLTKATCTTSYTPPLPTGACPASDPNFAFCR